MRKTAYLFPLLLLPPVAAQDAARTSSRLQETLDRYNLQEQVDARRNGPAVPEGFKTEEDDADNEKPTAEELKPVLRLKKLEFGETNVLPESLLAGLRARYERKKVSIADIKSMNRELNSYYREHGYLTCRAYLPEQDVSKGTLRMEFMEGTIGAVTTKGLTATRDAYVQRTAGIREGEIFHVPTIEQKLAEFNAFTDLRARLNISPGKAEGSSDIELVTQEHKRFSYKMNAYRTNTLAFVLDDLLFLDHGYLYNSLSLVRGWQLTENGRNLWRLAYRAEGNYTFNKYIGFNGRFVAQISNRHDLQSSEQIQLGGVNTVRGYEEGLVNGERGYALQAELRTNLASLWKANPAWLDSAEAFAFFDCGQLSHKTESAELSNQNSPFLSSVGCGLRVGLWQHLNATGTIAMPLKKHQYNPRDNKPHFLFAVGAEF